LAKKPLRLPLKRGKRWPMGVFKWKRGLNFIIRKELKNKLDKKVLSSITNKFF